MIVVNVNNYILVDSILLLGDKMSNVLVTYWHSALPEEQALTDV